MEQPSDAAVIASSLEDGKRFGEIFERHFPQIYRYVARRLGPEDAADVSGEVFATALRRRLDYDPSRPDALPWLYGIATRLVGNHRHAERRRLSLLSRSAGACDPGVAFDDVDARLDAQRLGPTVMHAISRLSPETAMRCSCSRGPISRTSRSPTPSRSRSGPFDPVCIERAPL